MRSLAVPSPAVRSRRGLAIAVAVLAVVAAGGFAVLHRSGLAARDYPAASLAGTIFGASQVPLGQGVAQTMNQVASDGSTVVAIGSQTGGDIPRAQFFVSENGGRAWRLAPVAAAGGGTPAPGHAAQFVVHGPRGWLAVGPHAIWTSTGGHSWTLASTTGVTSVDADDQMAALTSTSSGFLAVGRNAAEGTAVIWTSPDGLHWRRLAAAQLLLPAGDGTVADLDGAAAHGSDILLSGQVAPTAQGGVTRIPETWLSTDNGATWTLTAVPTGHGATGGLARIAATGTGFVAVRSGTAVPGTSGSGLADGVVYASAAGTAWRYVTTLTATDGVQIGVVAGGPGGFTALGRGPGGAMAAYLSANGLSWSRGIAFGPAPPDVSGATVTAGGTVVVTGSTTVAGRQQPYLALAPSGQAARLLNVAGLAGGTISQLGVDAVAVAGGQRIAVGEAAGSAAIWSAAGGSWSPVAVSQPGSSTLPAASALSAASAPSASSAPYASSAASASSAPYASSAASASSGSPTVPGVPGTGRLTSVAHGPAGWLATGETVSGTGVQRPLVVSSADGTVWRTASGPVLAGEHPVAVQAAAAGPGYVIVGADVTSAGTFPTAWWSADLRTWTRAGGPPAGTAQDDPGEMLGVTSGPAGFTAVGQTGINPAAWTSSDGRAWRLVTLKIPNGAASAELQHVAASGPDVVAFGTEVFPSAARDAFAEVSADGGHTWRPVTLPSPRGPATVTAVTAMRGGFIAVGTFGTAGDRDVVVWTFSDGGGWTMQVPNGTGLSGPGIHEITGLAASGGTLTGVGFTASESAEQPALWNVPAF